MRDEHLGFIGVNLKIIFTLLTTTLHLSERPNAFQIYFKRIELSLLFNDYPRFLSK